ncbi:hypothetical protein KDA23_03415 [Candidatus Saccharibacteria bacterium]|nr:hypothetical protein [Candidatus Saccharibacteria bacterium]
MKDTLRKLGSRNLAILAIFVVLFVGISVSVALSQNEKYTPTKLNNLAVTDDKTVCLQKTDNDKLNINSQNETAIANAVATSITDVPAGTNVDVYLHSFGQIQATGTAIYQNDYGQYNFTVQKIGDTSDPYTGGWDVTQFGACL